MEGKKLLIKNSGYTFLSYTITAIVQTLIYLLAAKKLGALNFGLWSFIYSGAFILGLSTVGLPNLLILNISRFFSLKEYENLTKYFIKGILIFFITFPIIITITGVFYYYGLKSLEFNKLSGSTSLLFLFLFFLQNLVNISFAFLDGIQKSYVKSKILIFSNLFFGLIFLIIVDGNIDNLIKSQLVFYFIQFILILIFIIRFYNKIKFKFNISHFKVALKDLVSMLKESKSYFAISISSIFFEPLARYLIGKYCGLHSIAYFEVTNRIAGGVRSLFLNVVQVSFPYLSYNHNTNSDAKQHFLYKITNYIFTFSFLVFLFLPIPVFILQLKTFGEVNLLFVGFIMLSSISNQINIISSPFYFFTMAENKPKNNTKYHLSQFGILLILTVFFVLFKIGSYVILLPSLAIIFSSVYLVFLIKKQFYYKKMILRKVNFTLLILVLIVYILCLIYYKTQNIFCLIIVMALCLGGCIFNITNMYTIFTRLKLAFNNKVNS